MDLLGADYDITDGNLDVQSGNLQRHSVEVGYLCVPMYEFVSQAQYGTTPAVNLSQIRWSATGGQEFPDGTARRRFPLDLRHFDEVRWRFYVGSAGTTTNGAMKLQYSTTDLVAAGSLIDLVSGGISLAVSAGQKDSGWNDLVSGAKVDGLYLGVVQTGTVGTANRSLDRMVVEFRAKSA